MSLLIGGGELWECLARNNSQVSKSGAFATDIIIMIPGSKGLNPHELAHRWGRVVGVLSTEQFVGIKVGDICPRHHIYVVKENAALSDDV